MIIINAQLIAVITGFNHGTGQHYSHSAIV